MYGVLQLIDIVVTSLNFLFSMWFHYFSVFPVSLFLRVTPNDSVVTYIYTTHDATHDATYDATYDTSPKHAHRNHATKAGNAPMFHIGILTKKAREML